MKKILLFVFTIISFWGCSEKFDDSEIWDKLNALENRVAALEQLCRQTNTNLTSIQTIVEGLQNNDYITNIAPIMEGDKVIGYTITFSKSGNITIYHGKDGDTPQIGVKQDTDGVYYWTIDGDWVLDANGNKIKTSGTDGATPQLKIENDYWYISYDNGANWEKLGEAKGENGDSIFSSITYDDDYVYITLNDGTTLVIPRNKSNTSTITYTATSKVTPNEDAFDANIISNEWDSTTGNGVITFDGTLSKIGEFAFNDCRSLVSITIPNGVTEIGGYAFRYCRNLVEITLPNSVNSVSYGAFEDCNSLTKFNSKFASQDGRCLIVDGILTAFAPYGITEYTIPDVVVSLGNAVFAACNELESLTIPNSVASIGQNALYSSGIKKFNGKFVSGDGCCVIIDDEIIRFAVACEKTSYTIPDKVTKIGYCAFDGAKNIENITLHNNVKTIAYYAFRYCNLSEVTIPESVTNIGHQAFNYNNNLLSIYCKPTTPPRGAPTMFTSNSDTKIYVPMNSAEAYKVASYWEEYADAIVGYNFD